MLAAYRLVVDRLVTVAADRPFAADKLPVVNTFVELMKPPAGKLDEKQIAAAHLSIDVALVAAVVRIAAVMAAVQAHTKLELVHMMVGLEHRCLLELEQTTTELEQIASPEHKMVEMVHKS